MSSFHTLDLEEEDDRRAEKRPTQGRVPEMPPAPAPEPPVEVSNWNSKRHLSEAGATPGGWTLLEAGTREGGALAHSPAPQEAPVPRVKGQQTFLKGRLTIPMNIHTHS